MQFSIDYENVFSWLAIFSYQFTLRPWRSIYRDRIKCHAMEKLGCMPNMRKYDFMFSEKVFYAETKQELKCRLNFSLWACVMPLLVETFRLNAKKLYGCKLLCTCTIRNFTYTWQKANCYSIFPAINNFISPVPWSNPWLDILLLRFFF